MKSRQSCLIIQFYILIFIFLVAQAKLETGSTCFIQHIDGQEIDPCPRLHYCDEGKCTRKTLANPHALEIVCYFFLFVLGGIACAAGVGASYTLAPIIILLTAYSANAAIRIVYCLIFGGMIAAFMIKCRRRDPETKTPLIQYELCLICLPMMVLGTTFGVVLNIILAPVVIAIALVITMIVSLIRIQRKIKVIREQERKKRQVGSGRASIQMNAAPKESNSPQDKNKKPMELTNKSSEENVKGQDARLSDENLTQNEDAQQQPEKDIKIDPKTMNPSIRHCLRSN